MIVGVCEFRLHFPYARSLKEKRTIIKPLLTRLRQRFNVSVAETEALDKWQLAVISVACVAHNKPSAGNILEKVSEFIENNEEITLIDKSVQFL